MLCGKAKKKFLQKERKENTTMKFAIKLRSISPVKPWSNVSLPSLSFTQFQKPKISESEMIPVMKLFFMLVLAKFFLFGALLGQKFRIHTLTQNYTCELWCISYALVIETDEYIELCQDLEDM